jgi:hypothetical protein
LIGRWNFFNRERSLSGQEIREKDMKEREQRYVGIDSLLLVDWWFEQTQQRPTLINFIYWDKENQINNGLKRYNKSQMSQLLLK